MVTLSLKCLAGLGAVALGAATVQAATTFSLDRAQAGAGETVEIQAVYINDTNAAADWTPAGRLVLQWRSPDGEVVRSLAYLAGEPVAVRVPVNNFARMSWRAIVPPGMRGMQAISIEGEPTLMALDTSPLETGPVAGTRAPTPIIDAGEPGGAAGSGQPLPDMALAGLGLEKRDGAAPNAAPPVSGTRYSYTAWEHVRNALSPHEPIYFGVGSNDGLYARFQISLKYRLFQPPVGGNARFHENLYVGYTQTSLWDLDSPSRPFYDTVYKPSLMWHSDVLWQSSGRRWSMGLTGGVEHRSNGQGGEDSRSLNAFFAQPALSYRLDGGSTLSFSPRVYRYFSVARENADYADYMGRVDWNLQWARDDGLMVAGLYRQGRDGRNSMQVDLAWPLRNTWLPNMNGYLHLQYYKGYGLSLLNYDRRSASQFRIGLMLVR